MPDFTVLNDDQIVAAGYLVRHNEDTKMKDILDSTGNVVATVPMS